MDKSERRSRQIGGESTIDPDGNVDKVIVRPAHRTEMKSPSLGLPQQNNSPSKCGKSPAKCHCSLRPKRLVQWYFDSSNPKEGN
jgi:hypothetical protein